MPLVIGVAFKPVTKVYYFDPAGFDDLQPGERVVVDTARGRTLGVVVQAVSEVSLTDISGTLKPVVRRATALDMVQQDQQAHREAEVLQLCRDRARALDLEMKVVRVEFNFEGSSLLVYFTAEQRIDFRNLVHDLAQALHAHVEMRQIGVRDEAKFLGGYGRCGRELCCAGWLREFTPVSIKMAKQQDLPLNPTEISGCCGRLLCCLSYENDFYGDARRSLPRINSTWMTPEGPGKVRQVHVLRNSVTVLVQGPNEANMYIEVPISEAERQAAGGCAHCPQAGAGDEDRLQALPAAAGDEPEMNEDHIGRPQGPDNQADVAGHEETLHPLENKPPAAPHAQGRHSRPPRNAVKRGR